MVEYRIAIVDDDEEVHIRLRDFLEKYQEEEDCKFVIRDFTDGDEIVESYKCQYDIIFLDIEMKRLSGMKTAEIIRNVDNEVQIIFVTNSAQYAIEGYRVAALSYLLKPASYFMFCNELKRTLNIVNRRKTRYAIITNQSDANRVALADIYYIESFKHKIIYHTRDAIYEEYGTMKEVEKKVEGDTFFRCNSGYLVNMRYVEGIKDNDAVINGGDLLKISRSRKKEFMEALLAFYARR